MNFRRRPILCTTLYRNPMQATNFGGTFDQLFLRIFLSNFHRRCLSSSSIPWCKKVKNDQKLKSRGGGPALSKVPRNIPISGSSNVHWRMSVWAHIRSSLRQAKSILRRWWPRAMVLTHKFLLKLLATVLTINLGSKQQLLLLLVAKDRKNSAPGAKNAGRWLCYGSGRLVIQRILNGRLSMHEKKTVVESRSWDKCKECVF